MGSLHNMPFEFQIFCDLLNNLSRAQTKTSSTAPEITDSSTRIVNAWFDKHDSIIPRHGSEAVAFLSCMFPERRADRVYNFREELEAIIQRALGLGTTRLKELRWWKQTNGVDFASAVEHVISATDSETRPGASVTLEEIDEVLDRVAAASPFSAVDLRNKINTKYPSRRRADDVLLFLLRKLHSSEAKWFIRMVLKTYSPARVPEAPAMRRFHFLLPDILGFQNSFEAAVQLLQSPTIRRMPTRVTNDVEELLKQSVAVNLRPQLGVMVTQATHTKARGITHCCQMAGSRRMSVERKYDGEYCQIHIDLSKDNDPIRIFSKSGRDSTDDRIGLHGALRDSLRLGLNDCKIEKQCILEGELLVWDSHRMQIEPFYKIRKHVRRSSRSLGTAQDSPVNPDEHLMIMFYDILLLDNIICATESHDKRSHRLRSVVQCIPGRAEIGTRVKIRFLSRHAPELLRYEFARAITAHWEGLVLKGCDDPYFAFSGTHQHIKLKKDYITGLGDTADFAIVGGRWDARDEQELRIGKLAWTTFYFGCLENKDDVQRFDAKPCFRVVGTVGRNSISKDDMLYLNRHGYFVRVPFALSRAELEVKLDQKQMLRPTELFSNPFVVEVMGAEFDKPADVRYFTLQFPRLQKIHEDRTFKETVSFDELQMLARKSKEACEESRSQEEEHWIRQLKGAESTNKPSACKLQRAASSTDLDSSSSTLKRKLCTGDSVGSDSPNKRTRRSSIGSRPSLLRPGPTHELEEARREARPPLSLPTDERQGQANQALPQQDVVSRSTPCSQNMNSVEVCGLSFTGSNLRPPCLISRSVIDLLSQPTQMLSKSLCEWRLSVTFSADYLLDCIESNSPRPGEGVRPVPHVVLVDAAHADTLTQDVRSLAWMVTKRLDSHKMVGNGIILFLQWEVLHVLGSVGDAEEIEVGKLFRACLAWDCSRKEGRVQEIWSWENSEVLNQL